MQRWMQRQCLSQAGSSCLHHLRGKMTSQKFYILNACKKKPISSDHTTQAVLFHRGTLLWIASWHILHWFLILNDFISVTNLSRYNYLILQWNTWESLYYMYSHTYVPLKIIWCLHILAWTINTLPAHRLPLLWRFQFSTSWQALWIVQPHNNAPFSHTFVLWRSYARCQVCLKNPIFYAKF